MQRSPTSILIMADVYRQHLLAEADLVRPKVSRRAGAPAHPTSAGGTPDRRVLIALCADSHRRRWLRYPA